MHCGMFCELALNEIPLLSPTATLPGSGAVYAIQTWGLRPRSYDKAGLYRSWSWTLDLIYLAYNEVRTIVLIKRLLKI